MKIEVNIEKKHFYILVGILFLGLLVVVVNAYGEGTPTIVGHHWNDIGGIPFGFADGTDDVGIANWNQLKSNGMPAGFADDVDNVDGGNAATTDGYSLNQDVTTAGSPSFTAQIRLTGGGHGAILWFVGVGGGPYNTCTQYCDSALSPYGVTGISCLSGWRTDSGDYLGCSTQRATKECLCIGRV